MSLTPEPPTNDLQMFGKLANITIIHIPISRVINANSALLLSSLLKALAIVINSEHYPLFVHCLDGRRISSLLVLLTRRLQCWSCSYAIGEYWKFQVCWKSNISLPDIEKQTVEIEKVIYNTHTPGIVAGGVDADSAQAQNIFELMVPAEWAPWLWPGERTPPFIQGWKFIMETPAVTITPSLPTSGPTRERPSSSSSPGLEQDTSGI